LAAGEVTQQFTMHLRKNDFLRVSAHIKDFVVSAMCYKINIVYRDMAEINASNLAIDL
jgi:hypothetical protein